MEGSHSGLVRTLGKRVWSNPPRVRIPHPPQKSEIGFRGQLRLASPVAVRATRHSSPDPV